MQIRCKACDELMNAERGTSVLCCRRCRVLAIPEGAREALASCAKMPATITLFENGERLHPEAGDYRTPASRPTEAEIKIVRRWFELGDFVGLLVGVVACAFFLFPVIFILGTVAALVVLDVPIAGIAVAGAIGAFVYALLAAFVNRSTIAVRAGTLSIRHGPLPVPWPRPITLATTRLGRIYCIDVSKGREVPRYDVMAALVDGRSIKLVGGFLETDQAVFVEHVLETRLDLEEVRARRLTT